MKKRYYVVEMLRWGDREQHSYVIGVFDDEANAIREANEHEDWRGGKYEAEITAFELNDPKSPERVYWQKVPRD